MKPVSPHHLLSAYLDGELAPAEREQVERLLEESASARQELRELEQVGELLRHLPRQALPKSFSEKLLDACQSDTAVFESETLVPATNSKPRSSGTHHADKRKNRWTGFARACIAASALALIVFFFWGKASEKERADLALHTPANDLSDKSTFPRNDEPDQLEMPMAAGNAIPADAFNEANLRQDGQLGTGQKLKMEEEQKGPHVAKAESSGGFGGANAERKPRFASSVDLKDVPVAQAVEAFAQPGEQIAVVKLLVADRRQGLKNLQTLLQRHDIALATPAEPGKAAPSAALREEDSAEADASVAVYVDASDAQLAAAMRDLQQDAAFSKLVMDSPIAAAQRDPSANSPSAAEMPAQGRNRVMQFGGGGAGGFSPPASSSPQVMRAARSPKPESESPPVVESKKAAEPQPKPQPNFAPANNKPGEKAAPEKAPAPSIGIANSEPLPRLADGIADKEKRDTNEKNIAANRQSGVPTSQPSTQRELTLSASQLDRLQKQIGEAKPKDAKTAGAEETSTGKRVLVLFVLVDQTTPMTDTPTRPAEKAQPSNDNGGS